MKWKKRLAELGKLRAKHGKDRSLAHPFPDLSVEQRTSPTSDRLDTPPALATKDLAAILGSKFKISYFPKSGYRVTKK